MGKLIALDGFELFANNIEETTEISKPTGNKLKKIKFTATVTGGSNRDALNKILSKSSFLVKIPDDELEIKAKKENSSYSYSGNFVVDDRTEITYNIEITELDKDLPEDWNPLTSTSEITIRNWIRDRAISELLIEKGIITEEEYKNKLQDVTERDFKNLLNYLVYGIEEK